MSSNIIGGIGSLAGKKDKDDDVRMFMSPIDSQCIVLGSNRAGFLFDEEQGIKKSVMYRFDPKQSLVEILIQQTYVVAVYEHSISIYNMVTGDLLEEMGKLEKQKQGDLFKYNCAAVNPINPDVFLGSNNVQSSKKAIQCQVFEVKEITYQDQIEYLFDQCRIEEAWEVFTNKQSKSKNFAEKKRQFQLNIGWVMLMKSLDFEKVIENFKYSDVDPRELVLLFKDFVETSTQLSDHILRKPPFYLNQYIMQNKRETRATFDENKVHLQAK